MLWQSRTLVVCQPSAKNYPNKAIQVLSCRRCHRCHPCQNLRRVQLRAMVVVLLPMLLRRWTRWRHRTIRRMFRQVQPTIVRIGCLFLRPRGMRQAVFVPPRTILQMMTNFPRCVLCVLHVLFAPACAHTCRYMQRRLHIPWRAQCGCFSGPVLDRRSSFRWWQ